MLYLNESDLLTLGTDWKQLIEAITEGLHCMRDGRYVQPIKPYLRFNDPNNRIIAMPAYIGRKFDTAGIKWIASYPSNPASGIPRAHSIVVLNESATGKPYAFINSPLLSILRTASVSAVMLRRWLELPNQQHDRPLNVCLIGCGPIGKWHIRMLTSILGPKLGLLTIYDLSAERAQEAASLAGSSGTRAADWRAAYLKADIVLTCTVSSSRYIDVPPPPGSLLLHVSLRDYMPSALIDIETIVVDDWNEICRENTDIDYMHRTAGLTQEQTIPLYDAVLGHEMLLRSAQGNRLLFAPMGMAVFDIAVASYYVGLAKQYGIGIELE
ncbi:2,3-diaminopropionate biosynthesis protein SbnB [Paenibacillus xylaniclasticus]|uniref:2,3-diaminopropionate biosynthesis protein SbnB n=1 Tax=Paenibacillus xylaniclasticus TaxID=588083 RepID=UPI000FDB7646|nr:MULTISPECIES: 2,3-diaminopropionate biosynthesis protein SbnB [Paenibacillus]GFN33680.1 2,3-diaminopropionate biosynthesis protein SbnB [Paenibacillus curdlanolyticus]